MTIYHFCMRLDKLQELTAHGAQVLADTNGRPLTETEAVLPLGV